MLKVGVTGGIGSGKSAVCSVMEQLGIPSFNADTESKRLMTSNKSLILEVIDIVGPDAYIVDDLGNYTLNRPYVASQIFSDRERLEQINRAVHPRVREAFTQWSTDQSKLNRPYLLFEAAILIETGLYKSLDYTILVTAPESMRIARAMERDGVSYDSVESRVKRQMADEEKLPHCKYVIDSGERELIIPQILRIDREIREL